jgi:hypothetical protein
MEGTRMKRLLLLPVLFTTFCFGQKYTGPQPEKADMPYLLHATTLLATEALDAKQEEKKEVTTYVIPGAASPSRTPLSEPIFLLRTEKLVPERLTLYKMEVKSGHREVSFNSKKAKDNPHPVPLSVKRLDQGLYRIEANDSMPTGEYCLSPEGSNQVFCFQVY